MNRWQVEALSLGPRFCAKQPYCSQVEIESKFENLMSQCQGLTPTNKISVDNFKSALVHFCQQYYKMKPGNEGMLTTKHKEAVKKLKDNQEIVITRPFICSIQLFLPV